MKHTISPDRTRLTITVDLSERAELRHMPKGDAQGCGAIIHMDKTMHEFLEPLTCNSGLQWIDASETGDLTDAPMLGLYGGPAEHQVLERWAFMDYQVRSVLEDLRDKGECVFVAGAL